MECVRYRKARTPLGECILYYVLVGRGKLIFNQIGKLTITRWVCFKDPVWESFGWVGRQGGVGWVGNITTTFIQLTVAGSINH